MLADATRLTCSDNSSVHADAPTFNTMHLPYMVHISIYLSIYLSIYTLHADNTIIHADHTIIRHHHAPALHGTHRHACRCYPLASTEPVSDAAYRSRQQTASPCYQDSALHPSITWLPPP